MGNNKVALITGSAVRVGREIALYLAKNGYDIAIHYNNSANEADKTVLDIKKLGVNAKAFKANFNVVKDTINLISEVYKEFKRIDVLINSASTFQQDTILDNTDKWDMHFNSNLKAPYILTTEFSKVCKNGNIINIVDQRVLNNLSPYYSTYTLSKSALLTLTITSSMALAPNIRVNAIAPGPIVRSEFQSEEKFKEHYEKTPLLKHVSYDDISSTILFIINNSSITGAVIPVDSGQHLGTYKKL